MNQILETLLDYAVSKGMMNARDRIYARNRVLSLMGEEAWEPTAQRVSYRYVDELLKPLCDRAVQKGIIEDTQRNRDAFDSEIMNCFMPRPSEAIQTFQTRYAADPKAASDWFYRLSTASNYIRMDRIAKNVSYKAKTIYGELDITINLSKPEKDPRDIAAARNSAATGYPTCVLCKECEGYHGSARCDGRSNHRVIPLTLGGEQWYLQYSPYVYYNEHCIVLCERHVPMQTKRETFVRLLDFVEQFPHYFLGSNADLPIVGGSILSHDHYQGGRYTFAMTDAAVRGEYDCFAAKGVTMKRLYWPLSVIRLAGADKQALIAAADHILTVWRAYSDPSMEILAHSGETPHNTISTIARYREGKFELDLVLRNNRASEQYPLGIFHPHAEVHHIKKENIGLIEVMGLAVLPARLKQELEWIADALTTGEETHLAQLSEHAAWMKQLKQNYTFTKENAEAILRQEVADIFALGLSHCGVFPLDERGDAAFERFVSAL